MTSEEIRQKFLDFFKARGHTIVPSSSLIPDDPSVLLTTAGMQQFKKYYTGEADPMKDFGSKNTASCQKSFRTSDIDEVGDESHLTFFEMLGNFSFGGYFKKEAITYAHEFITKEMGLKISYVTVFEGKEDIGVPKDIESRNIWKSLDKNLEVREQGMGEVFWGPTGSSGPCGPTTEIYCKNAAGQDIEVWNIVFNQYFYPGSREELNSGVVDKKLEPLKIPGVDTGMGLERLAMCVQKKNNIFETDLFEPLMDTLQSQYKYNDVQVRRILADHIRAITYLIADGVEPDKKGRGYILRHLLRTIATNVGKEASIPLDKREQPVKSWNERTYEIIKSVGDKLIASNRELQNREEVFNSIISKETNEFINLLKSGKELEEVINKYRNSKNMEIPGKDVFRLYSSLGVPIDYIKSEIKKYHLSINEEEVMEERVRHQEISRAGLEKKFGGHGLILDTGEVKAGNEEEFKKALRLHTTTHLLQRALREVLGNEVHQMGSDVTAERTRFDFSFPRKLTPEEIKKVENLINEQIKEDMPVNFVEMPKAEAEKVGALYFFKEKYPEKVKVYYIGKDLASAWSKEFCGGPHVTHTGEIGGIKIAKEEAVSAGVRRIRATLL